MKTAIKQINNLIVPVVILVAFSVDGIAADKNNALTVSITEITTLDKLVVRQQGFVLGAGDNIEPAAKELTPQKGNKLIRVNFSIQADKKFNNFSLKDIALKHKGKIIGTIHRVYEPNNNMLGGLVIITGEDEINRLEPVNETTLVVEAEIPDIDTQKIDVFIANHNYGKLKKSSNTDSKK